MRQRKRCYDKRLTRNKLFLKTSDRNRFCLILVDAEGWFFDHSFVLPSCGHNEDRVDLLILPLGGEQQLTAITI